MPLPLILGAAAALAGTAGVGLGIHGGVKMKHANDKMKDAQRRDESNNRWLKNSNESCCKAMDSLGTNEIQMLSDFDRFSTLFEKIHNKPTFAQIELNGAKIDSFSPDELKKASVGASVLVGGLGGAVLGTMGGFAASGATTAAVMALGAASTGTLIADLSGVAATNATLAVLGGGTLAAGGGGVALGTTILGATTLGVGLLVGGIVFSVTGSSIEGKADDAWEQMQENEKKIKKVCNYLSTLEKTARRYNSSLQKLRSLYDNYMGKLSYIVTNNLEVDHVDWNKLSHSDKLVIENCVLIVGIIYNMCKVKLVNKSETKSGINKINNQDIKKAETEALQVYEMLSESITFEVEYHTKWGENIVLYTKTQTHRMNYHNDIWSITLVNAPMTEFSDYFYSVETYNKITRTEGKHHKLDNVTKEKEIHIRDTWND